MKKIVILTGAGMSQESGLRTFREMGGLWEEYNVEEVASPQAWASDPELVQEFYNQRRKQLMEVEPNAAHKALAKLESKYDVQIITQNVDDLHERGGSSNILHLHGELIKVRSTGDESLVYTLDGWELKMGDKCEKGYQLRPHIVWFGEDVPLIETAARITQTADILIIIGTSMNVYPAAGLMHYAPMTTPIYFVDPGEFSFGGGRIKHIQKKATTGVTELVDELLAAEN